MPQTLIQIPRFPHLMVQDSPPRTRTRDLDHKWILECEHLVLERSLQWESSQREKERLHLHRQPWRGREVNRVIWVWTDCIGTISVNPINGGNIVDITGPANTITGGYNAESTTSSQGVETFSPILLSTLLSVMSLWICVFCFFRINLYPYIYVYMFMHTSIYIYIVQNVRSV